MLIVVGRSDPTQNKMPSVSYVSSSTVPKAGILGVSIQGSNGTFPGDTTPTMVPMNPYLASSDYRYIDVYTRNNGSFSYTIKSNLSYVSISPSSGTIFSSNSSDVRANITVDWASAPKGFSYTSISITGTDSGGKILTGTTLILPIQNTAVSTGFTGYVESNGVVAIEAEHYKTSTSSSSASYMTIPNYGRTLSGVTLTPVTCPSQTNTTGPKLSYSFYAFTSTTAKITLYFGSSLNFDATRPLTYGLQLDSGAGSTAQPVPISNLGTTPSGWSDAVVKNGWSSNVYRTTSVGSHTLNIWLLEPGLVLQRIVIDLGGVETSYLGPPESYKV